MRRRREVEEQGREEDEGEEKQVDDRGQNGSDDDADENDINNYCVLAKQRMRSKSRIHQ